MFAREPRIKADFLSDYLNEQMLIKFSTETDDDSDFEVATLLVDLYKRCFSGDHGLASEIFEQKSACTSESKASAGFEADIDHDDSDGSSDS